MGVSLVSLVYTQKYFKKCQNSTRGNVSEKTPCTTFTSVPECIQIQHYSQKLARVGISKV